MPLAVLVAAIAGYVYALVAGPRFRRWGLAAGLLTVLLLGLYLFAGGAPGRPEIAPEALTLDALDLERTPRGATLSGRVQNGSTAFQLLDMTLKLRLHDCLAPELAAAECPIIGESRAIARPGVPPGQIRGFSAPFVFANLPPVIGTLAWDWEVTDTRAAAP